MSEPENKVDPASAVTPPDAATPPKTEDKPANPAVPDPVEQLKKELEEVKAKEKRHLEQLKGKDKLIEELKIKKIVESFQPERKPEVVNEYDYEPTTPKAPAITPADAEQRIFINTLKMEKQYGKDPVVPFNEDVKKKIEEVLERMDPTGKVKLAPDAWEYGYKIVRGDLVEEVAKQREEAVRQEYLEKEKKVVQSHVESATPAVKEPTGPTVEDVLSGKVKMTAAEMLKAFPELQNQVDPRILKGLL